VREIGLNRQAIHGQRPWCGKRNWRAVIHA
jgi:hypothetical protein